MMHARNPVILCIDDEEAYLRLLEEILVSSGYEVAVAASGKDALQILGSQTIDLVLLDVSMPAMDGFEVCRRIKEDQALDDIPIIMITGLNSPEDHTRGIEVGVEDYFTKPINKTAVLARIKILLKIKRLSDERRRAESQKEAALAALQESCNELDYRVQVRTADLIQSNQLLQAEIAERKRTERELMSAKARVDFLLTSSPVMIYSCNTSGDFGATFVSENVKEHLGYQAREFITNPGFWAVHIHPEDTPRVFAEIPLVFQKGYHSYEYRFQNKNGEYIWMHDSMTLLRDKSAEPLEIVGAWLDITEHKKAEEELRKNENRYQLLFEAANDGIFIQDATGFRDCNKKGAEMYGITKEQIIGRSPSDFSPQRQPDGRLSSRVAEEKIRAAMNGGSQLFEWQALRADGTHLDVEITLNRIEWGGITNLQAIVRDITQRKKTEKERYASEIKFRQIFNESVDAIGVSRVGIHEFVNRAYASLFGYASCDELVDKPVLELIAPSEQPTIQQRMQRQAKGELLPMFYETRGLRQDGSEFIMDVHESSYELFGEVYTLVIMRDITARKCIENELVSKSRNLEEVNTALRILIKQVEEGQADLEGKILSNIRELVLPYLSRLRGTPLSVIQDNILKTAESNLNNITSTFLTRLKMKYYNLTPREIEVATFVREGKRVKDIADILCLSEKTIKVHRSSLREKLGLRNEKINLRSHLLSIK